MKIFSALHSFILLVWSITMFVGVVAAAISRANVRCERKKK